MGSFCEGRWDAPLTRHHGYGSAVATPKLSFPFRVLPNGQCATVEQDTPAEYEELVTALILTRLGERDLVPAFGVPDPVFRVLDLGSVQSGVSLFGPPVEVTAVDVVVTGENSQEITVTFEETAV